MRGIKRNTGLYAYLEAKDYLSKGKEAIALGKKEYRKAYLKEHKKRYRKRISEHNIVFKPKDEQTLVSAAKAHGMKVVEYIRSSSLAYTNKKYLVPQTKEVQQIQLSIIYLRQQIERIGVEKRGLFGESKHEKIEKLLLSLEETVRVTFQQPADLELEILKIIQQKPEFLEVLKTIVSGDNKISR